MRSGKELENAAGCFIDRRVHDDQIADLDLMCMGRIGKGQQKCKHRARRDLRRVADGLGEILTTLVFFPALVDQGNGHAELGNFLLNVV